jgi:hypothetical protein
MSFVPASSPPLGAPPRRPRRRAALVLLAGVVLLHALLLGGLPLERPLSSRPGPSPTPAPAMWTRSLPVPVSEALAPAALPAAANSATDPPGAPAEEPRAVAAAPRPEPAAPAPAQRQLIVPAPAASAATQPEAPPAPSATPAAIATTAATPATAAPATTAAAASTATTAANADSDSDEPDTGPAGGSAPPLYATRLPGPALLRFQLRRGPQFGQAQLLWQQAEDRYTIAFDAQAGGRPLIEQRSAGRSGPEGLAPEHFRDKRRGRAAQQASFDADTQRISFSGRAPDLPLWAGAQDRLGWIVQLAAIVAAAPVPPDEVTLFVVGARGGAGPWTFAARGAEQVATPLGPVLALHYERAPAVLRDQRVEAWLDPARGHWPVKLRFTPVLGGPPLELLLEGEPAKP